MIKNLLIKGYSTVLSHTGPNKMVNIGNKQESFRYAKAMCEIKTKFEVIDLIKSNTNVKGDVFRISEVAGIMAAKKTSELIPLCHQINLNTVKLKITIKECLDNSFGIINIESYVETCSKTGVEMEALMAVNMCALTIYDMCKSLDKEIEITNVRLLEKYGGKSGHFISKFNSTNNFI